MSVSGLPLPAWPGRRARAARAGPGWYWDGLERVVAAGALVLSLPVVLVAAVAVMLLSGCSPLVAHERVGLRGRRFWMLKLRTMWNERRGWSRLVEYVTTEGVPGPKVDPDPRVRSRLARLLRRYSIDELPQLLHVLSGRMALIGPRPLVKAELETYYGPDAEEVLSVKPGLTGLWQVCGRSRLDYAERRRLDLYLVRHRSVRLYLRILVRTIPVVILARDSW